MSRQRPIEPVRALTAVRGLAAWWVVAFHFREALPPATPAFVVSIAASGYLAVDLFFILSGYVIALNYSAWFERERPTAPLLGRFLGLRLSRIYPLHVVMLVLFVVNACAARILSGHAPAEPHIGYLGLSFVLMQGWGFVRGLHWNVPAWSISAEWLAYLLFPLLAALASRLAATRLRAAVLMTALLAVLAASSLVGGPGRNDSQLFGLVRCVLEFSAGICLYRFGWSRVPAPSETMAALLFAACCFVLYAVLPISSYLIVPLGFAALVHGLSVERGRLAALLRRPAVQWLGLVSYSTYMSHYLVKDWTKLILVRPGIPPGIAFFAYAVTVLAASLVLHAAIERPGQRWLRRQLSGARASAGAVVSVRNHADGRAPVR